MELTEKDKQDIEFYEQIEKFEIIDYYYKNKQSLIYAVQRNDLNTVINLTRPPSMSPAVVKYFIDSFQKKSKALNKACIKGNLNKIKDMVKEGLTAEIVKSYDGNALTQAVKNKHFDIVKYLIDHFQLTSDDLCNFVFFLNYVIESDNFDIFQFVIERITPYKVKFYMNQMLSSAISRGNLKLVKYLITKYEITLKDIYNGHGFDTDNPILAAVNYNQDKILEYFHKMNEK